MRIFIILIAILINLVVASEASAAEQIARNLTSAKESELGRISQILATKPSEQSAFLAQENKPNGTQNQTDANLAGQTQGHDAMQNETQILTAASAAHKNFKDATNEKLPPNSTLQNVALNKRLAQMPQDESTAQTARILAADSNAKAEFELQDGKQTSVQNTTKNDQETSNLTSYKSAAISRIAQNPAAKIDERHKQILAANSSKQAEKNLARYDEKAERNLASEQNSQVTPSTATTTEYLARAPANSAINSVAEPTEPTTKDEAKRLYEAAVKLEHEGDKTRALQLYKLAAKKAIFTDEDGETAAMERSVIAPSDSVADAPVEERKIAVKERAGAKFESGEAYDVDEILGLKMHHLNYLLPATYTLNRFEDRRRFETAFQISLQKPLFYDVFDMNETISAGYSQSSWWQTAKASTPFRETNYRPEIFVTFPTRFEAISSLDYLRAGLLHESNGQGGEKSRSWNRVYLEAKFYAGSLVVIPRAWARIPEKSADDDNPDIEKYLGNMDVNFALPYRGHIFTAMVRNNLHFDKTNRGAGELGWLFPFGKSGVYGYVKYFTGYGESLIDYNRHTDKIGIGFAILK